jgi:hypothetical protein
MPINLCREWAEMNEGLAGIQETLSMMEANLERMPAGDRREAEDAVRKYRIELNAVKAQLDAVARTIGRFVGVPDDPPA